MSYDHQVVRSFAVVAVLAAASLAACAGGPRGEGGGIEEGDDDDDGAIRTAATAVDAGAGAGAATDDFGSFDETTAGGGAIGNRRDRENHAGNDVQPGEGGSSVTFPSGITLLDKERPVVRYIPRPRPPEGPTAQDVMRKIQAVYLRGLKACLQKAHENDPDASGKVKLSFAIDVRGRVARPEADGFDDALDACIVEAMSKWRFRPFLDYDGTPVETSITLTLNAAPPE